MAREKPVDDRVQMTLRLPADLHETLVKNLRSGSLNADIVERLWQSVELGLVGSVTQPPVRVLVDMEGRVTNWPEVHALAAQITEAFHGSIHTLAIEVRTPLQKVYDRRQSDFTTDMDERFRGGDEAPLFAGLRELIEREKAYDMSLIGFLDRVAAGEDPTEAFYVELKKHREAAKA